MSNRITEADRMEAVYTWLSAAQVARIYFPNAEHPEKDAVSATTIMRWHDDENHPLKGANFARDDADRRNILFQPEKVEAFIESRLANVA